MVDCAGDVVAWQVEMQRERPLVLYHRGPGRFKNLGQRRELSCGSSHDVFLFLKIGDEVQVPSSPDQALTGAFLKAEQLPFPSQPLAEAAAMLLEQFGDFAGGFLAGPITLQFTDVGPGRYRDRPRLDHALDRHV